MKSKNRHLILLLTFVMSLTSCVSVDESGRRWVSVPTPGDPLGNLILDGLSGRLRSPQSSRKEPDSSKQRPRNNNVPIREVIREVPDNWINVGPGEAPLPPDGYMYSVIRENNTYIVRGKTGPSRRFGSEEYKAFEEMAQEFQWKIKWYAYRTP